MKDQGSRFHFEDVQVLIAFLMICAGGGCSRPDLDALGELSEARSTIERLEGELARVEAGRDEAIARLNEQHAEEMTTLETSLRRQINDYSRTIGRLRQELETPRPPAPPAPVSAAASSEEPAPAPAAAISVFSAGDVVASNFTIISTGDSGPPFPLAVENVRARSVVVGRHKSTRVVETDILVKDAFGQEVPLRKEVDVERDEYDTVVEFRVTNLGDRPAHIECRAGREMLAFDMEPRATLDQRLGTRIGASLQIRVDDHTRSFEVPYPSDSP